MNYTEQINILSLCVLELFQDTPGTLQLLV